MALWTRSAKQKSRTTRGRSQRGSRAKRVWVATAETSPMAMSAVPARPTRWGGLQRFTSLPTFTCHHSSSAAPADRTNVPLKNWGGFSEFRDAVYDDLERLVTAGLADRVLLNTRPLSRVEAARIVARAIEKIRNDDAGGLNARRDLEPVLDRLIEELKVELTSLGVRTSEGGTAPGFFAFTPNACARSIGVNAKNPGAV